MEYPQVSFPYTHVSIPSFPYTHVSILSFPYTRVSIPQFQGRVISRPRSQTRDYAELAGPHHEPLMNLVKMFKDQKFPAWLKIFAGKDNLGFGFGGTGKKSFSSQFDNYGEVMFNPSLTVLIMTDYVITAVW